MGRAFLGEANEKVGTEREKDFGPVAERVKRIVRHSVVKYG